MLTEPHYHTVLIKIHGFSSETKQHFNCRLCLWVDVYGLDSNTHPWPSSLTRLLLFVQRLKADTTSAQVLHIFILFLTVAYSISLSSFISTGVKSICCVPLCLGAISRWNLSQIEVIDGVTRLPPFIWSEVTRELPWIPLRRAFGRRAERRQMYRDDGELYSS